MKLTTQQKALLIEKELDRLILINSTTGDDLFKTMLPAYNKQRREEHEKFYKNIEPIIDMNIPYREITTIKEMKLEVKQEVLNTILEIASS